MKYLALPEKNSKEEPNIVEITNRKIDPTSESGKKFLIPANKFEYPQVETDEEMAQICGGQERVRDIFNEFLRDGSVTDGKNRIRMATSGTEDDIIAAGLAATKNFTFIEQARITAAEAKEKFSDLRKIASEQNLSDEDLAAAVRKMLGL